MTAISATYDQLLQFVQNVACLHRTGDRRRDLVDCDMAFTHAHEDVEDLTHTVDNLVFFARQLTPARPDDLLEQAHEPQSG